MLWKTKALKKNSLNKTNAKNAYIVEAFTNVYKMISRYCTADVIHKIYVLTRAEEANGGEYRHRTVKERERARHILYEYIYIHMYYVHIYLYIFTLNAQAYLEVCSWRSRCANFFFFIVVKVKIDWKSLIIYVANVGLILMLNILYNFIYRTCDKVNMELKFHFPIEVYIATLKKINEIWILSAYFIAVISFFFSLNLSILRLTYKTQ